MKAAFALIVLSGCTTIPDSPFVDSPIRVSTDAKGSVAVSGPNFELSFAATGIHLPEHLWVDKGRIDLLGTEDVCNGESRVGIVVVPAAQASAGTRGNALRSEITTLLAGPAVAKIRVTFAVDYDCPGPQSLTGTSEFTVFPTGRIVREDIAVRPSTDPLARVGNCGCQHETEPINFHDLVFSSFWAFQPNGATQVQPDGSPIANSPYQVCTMYAQRAVGVAWTQPLGTATRYHSNLAASHNLDWPTIDGKIEPMPQSVTSAVVLSDTPPGALSDCAKVLAGLANVALTIGNTHLEATDHDGIYRDPAPHSTSFDVRAVNQPIPPGFAISVDLAGANHATLTRSPETGRVGIAQREAGNRFLFTFFDGLSPGDRITIEPHP